MGVTVSSSYSATKFALHGYFDGLRSEVSRDGLAVILACPGPVKSEIVKRAMIQLRTVPLTGQNDHPSKRLLLK